MRISDDNPPVRGRRRRVCRRPVWGLLPLVGLLACASPSPPRDPAPMGVEPVVAAQELPGDRAQARTRAAQALEALALAHRELLVGELEAGLTLLAEARSRVADAQALLPRQWVLVRSPGGGEPLRLAQPQPPFVVPISSLSPPTLEALRPYRLSGAHGVRVDLDLLERRLARALEGPPERALPEVFLAAGTALRLEREPASHLVKEAPRAAGTPADEAELDG